MLNKAQIRELIEKKNLLTRYMNLEVQLTPNGFDLTAGEIFTFEKAGEIDFSNKERIIPECVTLVPQKKEAGDKFGWWHLAPGAYKVRTNETVNLPTDMAACAFPRSSLLRVGAFVQNGVWDSGFSGRSEFVLAVGNPGGLKLKQNARIIQLVFFTISETEAYKGMYNGL